MFYQTTNVRHSYYNARQLLRRNAFLCLYVVFPLFPPLTLTHIFHPSLSCFLILYNINYPIVNCKLWEIALGNLSASLTARVISQLQNSAKRNSQNKRKRVAVLFIKEQLLCNTGMESGALYRGAVFIKRKEEPMCINAHPSRYFSSISRMGRMYKKGFPHSFPFSATEQ